MKRSFAENYQKDCDGMVQQCSVHFLWIWASISRYLVARVFHRKEKIGYSIVLIRSILSFCGVEKFMPLICSTRMVSYVCFLKFFVLIWFSCVMTWWWSSLWHRFQIYNGRTDHGCSPLPKKKPVLLRSGSVDGKLLPMCLAFLGNHSTVRLLSTWSSELENFSAPPCFTL